MARIGTATEGDRHGALMDAVYRRQRYIYDATRKYYLLGRDRLIAELSAEPESAVLEVGCGTGRNLIIAARKYPKARFFGFDISEQMLETARRKIDAAGLSDRITLTRGDAASFDAEAAFGVAMDRVFFSYTLSMIPPWREALATGLAALRPDGSLHLVDFGQLERLPRAARSALGYWLKQFHVSPRAELPAVIDALAAQSERRAKIAPLYRGYAWIGTIR